jgi:hypothetical protein
MRSVNITTRPALIDRLMAQRRSRHYEGAACRNRSTGNDFAAVFTSCQLRLEQEFAPDTSKVDPMEALRAQ